MKSLTKDFFKTTIAVTLAFVFAIGLSVVNADWTAPISTAPTCTTGNPGCDAPINVSSVSQIKNGGLSVLGLLVQGGLQITSGSPGLYKVLTSDAAGNATWQAATVASSVPSGTWCGSGYVRTGNAFLPAGTFLTKACQGLNPATSCPSGYTQTIHSYTYANSSDQTSNARSSIYTCIKD
jgi:hypothetical protein